MKGFLGGVSIGALVAVAGAAMWSLSSPLPDRVQVDTTTPDQSSQPETVATQAPQTNEHRDADLVEAAPSIPTSSSNDDTSPIAILDTSPGLRPVVATAEGASAGDMTQGAGVESLPQAPSTVSAETASGEAPNAPGHEEAPVVSTETAAVPPAQATAESDPEELAPLSEPQASAELATSAGETGTVSSGTKITGTHNTVAGNSGVELTDTETAGSAETVSSRPSPEISSPVATAPVVPDLSGPEIGTAPIATALPSISGNPVTAPPIGDVAASEETDPAQADPAQEETTATTSETSETQPQSNQDQPGQEQLASAEEATIGSRLGTRVVPLTERGTAAPTLIGSNTEGASAAVADNGIPFEINAEAFTALADRPLMSIVLIDDEAAIGAEALEGFPYPLTFAISPQDPKAAEKMQARRAAGFEVLILADLPREATPQDAETAMGVWLEQLPQAVGVLEGVETGFQGNRPLADQMVAVMKATGYGMVTQNSGLNTVQKLALRDGMPSGVVFRDFDGAGQNPRAIRRFLDQAAFRARQEGAVIMLGRLRPDTISALLLWGLQDRASQVGLAPISAGLKAILPSAE